MSVQVFFLLHSTTVQNFPFILNFTLFFSIHYMKCALVLQEALRSLTPQQTQQELLVLSLLSLSLYSPDDN